jgi:hypothetical protein
MGCIPMNLQFSYHPWCWGHWSSLSSTFVLIGHLHVEAYFIIKVCEQNIFISTSRRYIGHKVGVIKLGQLVEIFFFPNSDDKMDVDPRSKYTHMYKIGKHTCVRLWNFTFKVHMALLEAVKVHWPDDGYLTHWTWMPSLEHVCFGLLSKLLNIDDPYKGNTHMQETCLLAQVLGSFHTQDWESATITLQAHSLVEKVEPV